MSNLTNVRLVPPSAAQSQDPRPGVRPVPLSPSSAAESGPAGDKFGDMDGRACPVLIGQHGAMAIEQASRPNALLDIRDRRDVVTVDGLRPTVRAVVLAEAVPL